ncbi:hypothetical protein SAMN05216558_4159 [Pseudomonas vancouverensis]|nr:hypothetical protein SAMN05216558_4159 [Pseudomonas vancouverensis]
MPIKRKLVFLWQSLSWLVWALFSAWAIVKIFDL